jgi:hypothetical protein
MTLRDRYPEMGIGADDGELDDLVGDLDALGRICRMSTLPSADAARITSELQTPGEEHRRIPRPARHRSMPIWHFRPTKRRLVPGVTVAGAAVLAWVLVISPLFTGGQGASAAAARVLRAASHTASVQPAHSLQAGDYAYTKSEGAYFDETSPPNGEVWGALVRTRREIWIAQDGSGRIRQVSDTPVFLSPNDRLRWEAAGAPPLSGLSASGTYDRMFAAGRLYAPLDVDGLHQGELLRMANNPDGLGAAIRALAAQNSNPLGWEMLTIVGDILAESAAPPKLRASLYQVAASIPGIELVGTIRDRAGRTGIAVAANRHDLRLELIFDPTTSALLAKQETLLHSEADTSAPPGTAVEYTLYLKSGIVSSRDTTTYITSNYGTTYPSQSPTGGTK